MGLLEQGSWRDQWYDTERHQGAFIREDSQFRQWIYPPDTATDADFVAAEGRYHLYVSLACPWAHRSLIFRQLKGLQALIPVTVVEPLMLEQGWEFAAEGEPLYGYRALHQLYTHAQADYSGRVTVPVLWDRQRETIVNNESADIIRIFNSAFDHLTGNSRDFYPAEYAEQIDYWNGLIYPTINNGVYRAGFATSQRAYELAFTELFDALDMLDRHLAHNRYLCGLRVTEADWRLFTTLLRFDAVYYGHFKTNRQRLEDYSQLSAYLRDLYQQPGVAETVNMRHIKLHYYGSHRQINPSGIVPLGPELDFRRPHGRERLGQAL